MTESLAKERISPEELSEIKASLETAKSKADIATIGKLLVVLQAKLITRKLLEETVIGKTLSTLCKLTVPDNRKDLSEDVSDIKKRASVLVEQWKIIFKQEKNQDKQQETTKKAEKPSATSPVIVPAKVTEEKQEWKPAFEPDTGDLHRNKIARKFMEIISAPIPLDAEDSSDNESDYNPRKLCMIGVSIENAVFELTHNGGKITNEYNSKVRSLVFNLTDKSNIELKKKLIKQDIKPRELAQLSAHELASAKKKEERKNAEKEALDSRRTDIVQEHLKKTFTGNGFFTCKCGSKKTSYHQMQTRGADEPMTNFINCHDCGNQWKR